MRQQNTGAKLTAAERRKRAVQRRIGGYTFQDIGDELGITKAAAHKTVKEALRILNEDIAEEAAELKRIQKEQLATMTNAIWGAVLKGDLGAISAMDRIQKRLAALEGMDAPKNVDLTSGGEKISIAFNWTDATDND